MEPCTPTWWPPRYPSCPCGRPRTGSIRARSRGGGSGRPPGCSWWSSPLVVLLVLVGTAWTVGLLAVTVAAGAAYVVAVPPWLYRISRWEVTDRAVYTLHGWLVREWRIAPISRVQTVDTQRGPLQQLLGLADVTVTTASARGAVRIRGLAADDAAELARVLTATTHATPGDAT